MGTDQHVVRDGHRWVVRAAGSSVPSSVHTSREQAIEAARRLARFEGGALVVQR